MDGMVTTGSLSHHRQSDICRRLRFSSPQSFYEPHEPTQGRSQGTTKLSYLKYPAVRTQVFTNTHLLLQISLR